MQEGLWLDAWGRVATPADGVNEKVIRNLKRLFRKMDHIFLFLDERPIIVQSAYRPIDYNVKLGHCSYACHDAIGDRGGAIDFYIPNMTIKEVSNRLLGSPEIRRLGVRIISQGERHIHIDNLLF